MPVEIRVNLLKNNFDFLEIKGISNPKYKIKKDYNKCGNCLDYCVPLYRVKY